MKNPNGFGGITKLKGNRRKPYWVRITTGWDITPTGKQKQIYKTLGYYTTRKEARLALAEYNANPFDLASAGLTFEQVWDKWSPRHFEQYPSSEKGLKAAYNKCSPIHTMKMVDIRTAHLQSLLDGISTQSVESQVKMKTVFKNTFKYAMENDIIKKDYSDFVTVSKTERQDKVKFFSKKDIELLLKHKDEPLAYTIVILLYTGMRITELLEVKTEDVDLEKRLIHVHGTKTKSADRIVPIHKDLLPYLEKCMDREYLVVNPKGKLIIYDNYNRTFYKPFMEKLGLEQTVHATRHTFISRMDSCGVSAESVVLKRIVGHSNKTVTEQYTHKTTDELIEAIDKFTLV